MIAWEYLSNAHAKNAERGEKVGLTPQKKQELSLCDTFLSVSRRGYSPLWSESVDMSAIAP